MRDTKAFASLTSGLLARKGQARPAMRPQGGFGMTMGSPDDLGWNDMGHDVPRPEGVRLPASLSGAPAIALPRNEPPVVRQQQDEIAEAMAAPAPASDTPAVIAPTAATIAPPAPAKAAPAKSPAAPRAKGKETRPPRLPHDGGRKAAFTLRLEAERHLRLRLACAVENRSAQQIVTAALDRFLATLPDVERLATSLPAKRGGKD